jgi:prepilin-type N-terminal cleavage/methylation domain-containing protein
MHAFVTPAMPRRRPAYGFTLIELMIVVAIAAILVTIGAPALGEFMADQRVRTTASDIAADFAFARVKAIENSRRAYIQKTSALWKNGWRVYVDQSTPPDDIYQAGVDQELKVFNGFPPKGTMYVCSTVADFATHVSFRPDGRVVRSAGAVSVAADGIYVVDTLGGGAVAKNKIRGLLFGVSGRVTVVKLNGTAPPCTP